MNELQMSMDGQWDIIGKDFYNPRTGDHVKVRDIFNDGSQFQIRTFDNQLLDMDEFSRYVQSDVPLGKLPPAPKTKINIGDLGDASLAETVQEENLDDIYEKALQEEHILNDPILPQNNTSQKKPQVDPQPLNQNDFIIEKALSKCVKPTISIDYIFEDNDGTAKAISVLKDVMDIDEKEIAEYYFNKFIKGTLEDVAKEAFNAKFAAF